MAGERRSNHVVNRPLAGIRIADLTHFWSGPEATVQLATLGADVIKIESIRRPDAYRVSSAGTDREPGWYERGAAWLACNIGKRDVTLDLTSAAGRQLFLRLVSTCDVVIDNFSPRVMSGLGLDFAALRRVKPDIVVLNMSSFGLTGPWRDYLGFAHVFDQLSGLASLTGYEGGPPSVLSGIADSTGGLMAAFGVIAALEYRDAHDVPIHIDFAQVDALAALTGAEVIEAQLTGHDPERRGNRDRRWEPHGVFRSLGDDHWVAIAVTSDDEWASLVGALGDPQLAQPELAGVRGRRAAAGHVSERIEAWTSARSRQVTVDALQAVGVPCGVVLKAGEIQADEQYREREMFATWNRPFVGEHSIPVSAQRFSHSDFSAPGPAPTLGQHNVEVLSALGLEPSEIGQLESDGLIGTEPE